MKIKNLKVLVGAFTLTSLVLTGCNKNNNDNVNLFDRIKIEFSNHYEGKEISELEERVEVIDDEIKNLDDERKEILRKIESIKKENESPKESNSLVTYNELLENYDYVTEYINLNDQYIRTEEEFNYVLDKIIKNRRKVDTEYLSEKVILNVFEFENYSTFTKQKFNQFLIELGYIHKFEAEGLNLKDISFLENTEIRNLQLSKNEIFDIDVLSTVKNIRDLNLEKNKIKNISSLSEQGELQELYLSYNDIVDLTPLSNLQYIDYLELSNNNISDLSPLKNLVNIKHLYLDCNNISDVNALNKIYALITLDLNGNNISDVSPLLPIIEKNDIFIIFTELSDENINAIRSVRDEDDSIYSIKR